MLTVEQLCAREIEREMAVARQFYEDSVRGIRNGFLAGAEYLQQLAAGHYEVAMQIRLGLLGEHDDAET